MDPPQHMRSLEHCGPAFTSDLARAHGVATTQRSRFTEDFTCIVCANKEKFTFIDVPTLHASKQ
jgi:hypothetical protein